MQGGVPDPNRFVECIWLRNFRATQISTSFSLVACVLVLYDLGLQPHHATAQELRKLSEGAGEEVDAGTIAVETSGGTYYWNSFFLDDLQGIPFPKCSVNANLYSSQRCSCTYFLVVLSIWTVAAVDRDLKFWKQPNTKKPPLEKRCSFLEIIFFWMGIMMGSLLDSQISVRLGMRIRRLVSVGVLVEPHWFCWLLFFAYEAFSCMFSVRS